MTKKEKIKYILAYQNDIDEMIGEDFDFPYNKEYLIDADNEEINSIYRSLLEAEELTEDAYQRDYIRHGRAE